MIRIFEWKQDNPVIESNRQRLFKCIQVLKNLRLANIKLSAELDNLNKEYC